MRLVLFEICLELGLFLRGEERVVGEGLVEARLVAGGAGGIQFILDDLHNAVLGEAGGIGGDTVAGVGGPSVEVGDQAVADFGREVGAVGNLSRLLEKLVGKAEVGLGVLDGLEGDEVLGACGVELGADFGELAGVLGGLDLAGELSKGSGN